MSGSEYLTLCARLRSLPSETVDRRIDALLTIFDLHSDRNAPMTAYSKGMRQKVLISAALLHDPAVIVFDEPCSGLDVAGTLILRSLVRRLAAEGRIIIYSSHVLEMVEQVCSEVLILHEGRVAAQNSVDGTSPHARCGIARGRLPRARRPRRRRRGRPGNRQRHPPLIVDDEILAGPNSGARSVSSRAPRSAGFCRAT